MVHFPVQTNISAKQTLEDKIRDLKTRKAGQREDGKALGINREKLAVEAPADPLQGTAEPSSWYFLILSRFAQILLLEAEESWLITTIQHDAVHQRCKELSQQLKAVLNITKTKPIYNPQPIDMVNFCLLGTSSSLCSISHRIRSN